MSATLVIRVAAWVLIKRPSGGATVEDEFGGACKNLRVSW